MFGSPITFRSLTAASLASASSFSLICSPVSLPNLFSRSRRGARPFLNPGNTASLRSSLYCLSVAPLIVSSGISMTTFFLQGPAFSIVTVFFAAAGSGSSSPTLDSSSAVLVASSLTFVSSSPILGAPKWFPCQRFQLINKKGVREQPSLSLSLRKLRLITTSPKHIGDQRQTMHSRYLTDTISVHKAQVRKSQVHKR